MLTTRPVSARNPPRWLLPLLVGVVLGLVLSGADPLVGRAGPVDPPIGERPSGPSRVVVAPAYAMPSGARDLGALAPSSSVSALVGLAFRDPSGLAARVALEEIPGSPLYRQYLNASELTDQYGPSAATVAAAVAYFAGEGVHATPTADHLLLELSGSARAFDRAFDTDLTRYQLGTRVVFAHSTPASLPAGLPWTGALGLGNTTPIEPAVGSVEAPSTAPAASGCATYAPFEPCEIDKAYNITPLFSEGENGSGERLAVVDAYDSAEPQPQLSKDLALFAANFSLPNEPPSYVYPVPTSTDLNDSPSSGWSAEEALDLEWARASAPGAQIEMVLSPNPSIGLYESVDWLVAHQAANVISMSWGEPDVGVYNAYSSLCTDQCNATTDGSYTLLHPVLEEAAAEGIGLFAASGDCGAAGGTSGVSTDYPASDPYVTGIGGTVLNVNPDTGDYVSESGWSGNASGAEAPGCVNQGGSGGGFSPYPRPAWQSGPGVPTNVSGRGVPDVSMVGGSPVWIYLGGEAVEVEGTSEGTPMWSGFEAIADQAFGSSLGSLNPALYALARGLDPGRFLHDITKGNNGYAAGPGWDPVTGLGTPLEAPLLSALTASSPPAVGPPLVTLGATPRLGAAPLNNTFTIDEVDGQTPTFLDVYFGDGNASLVPVTPCSCTSWSVTHAYTSPGVYAATVTAVDASGNSTTSSPVVIVVGGGSDLDVNLTVSNDTLGDAATFTAHVSGGTAPYLFDYYFGDGTYEFNSTETAAEHVFDAPTSGCAAVVVQDSHAPEDGGASVPVPIDVGGAPAPTCLRPTPLTANFSSAVTAADLPGDFPLSLTTTGGIGPISVQYVSEDPYVAACDCGIFRTTGNRTIVAYVNDSFDQELVRSLDVTVYPALTASPNSSALTGTAPFDVTFSLPVSGGHFTTSPLYTWRFGDGESESTNTSNVTHQYTTPGVYLATGAITDQGGGTASAAWIVDVTNGSSGLVVTGTISPAVLAPYGSPVRFEANASGGTGPYLYRWSLGENDSAFGSSVEQSYTRPVCGGNSSCPLPIGLTVTDASGATWSEGFSLPTPFAGRASGATFTDSGEPGNGTTPFRVYENATATGVRGLSIAWSFGDGDRASGGSVVHSYYDAGNYTMTELATDPYGDALVRTHAITVTGPPVTPLAATATASVTAGVRPLTVEFSATASGGTGPPYSVNWSFGDTQFATAVPGPVNHTYTDVGTMHVVATVSDSHGDRTSTGLTVQVYDVTPVAFAINVTPDPALYGTPVELSIQPNASCDAGSVPGCSEGLVPFVVLVGNASAPLANASPAEANPPAVVNGWSNSTLPGFDGLAGPLWVWVEALGPNYTGASFVPEEVVGICACGPVPAHGLGLDGLSIDALLTAATLGAAGIALAVVAYVRRRPPEGATPVSP